MVLSTTKKTSAKSSITNQNQGGGNKKYGLIPTATGESWYYRFIGVSVPNTTNSRCCTMDKVNELTNNAAFTRPIGRNYNPDYWRYS
jgi:hypothetical protein